MNRVFPTARAVLAAVVLTSACQSREANGNPDSGAGARGGATAATSHDSSSRATGLAGTAMDTSVTAMMDSLRAEMTRIEGMSPDQMKASIAAHRQMAANMLAQMNGDMRAMNMSGDAQWTAVVDSVRQDLMRLPDISGAQLKTLVTAHRARMERLMTMHQDMMGKMSSGRR